MDPREPSLKEVSKEGNGLYSLPQTLRERHTSPLHPMHDHDTHLTLYTLHTYTTTLYVHPHVYMHDASTQSQADKQEDYAME